MKTTGKVFADIDISLDGFIAGENVSRNSPLGTGGEQLIWYGDDVNDENANLASTYGAADAEVLAESAAREGAVIMGRTTFDVSIDAWGDNPPIHKPCFVLSHRPAAPRIAAEGGTTFTFLDNIHDALRQALQAAQGRDVGIMGGAQTIRQFLAEDLLDELHLHLVPVLLGSGIRLFDHGNTPLRHFRKLQVRDGIKATHLRYETLRRPERQ